MILIMYLLHGKQEKRKSMLELKKSLEIIEKASLDGAETVRRIQEFSRRRADDKDFTQVDINELIDNALEFTRVRWKNDAESKGIRIRIKKELSPLNFTLGSSSELREVFTNLINNAIDAIPQGGEIRINSLMKDNNIVVKIGDTGDGIPNDIKDRVFDPFFTTKGVQSTGLGLSVSYGIVNRHHGTIAVDSVEGEGTTFTIKFP
ncbi:MAG: HAMP domain-containing histidine kinase, partial [Deltaproteobacteria bacterium]|nr:HAMP domain-containing histidine kinase [Deltaproteobacteria bacterium]